MVLKKVIALILAAVMVLSLFGCSGGTADGEEADTTATETTVKKPEKMPDFKVYDMEGNEVTLYESFGKPLVVNFWATWCPPCKAEMPGFDAMYKKYGDKVNFMMINMTDGQRDTVDLVKSFIADNGYSFPVYCDSDMNASAAYGVSSIPMTMFFDSEGNLLDNHVGMLSDTQLESMLKRMTEGTK